MGRNYLILAPFLGALSTPDIAWSTPEVVASAPNSENAQDQTLMAACAKLPCRKAIRHFSLRSADGNSVEVSTTIAPYINDKGAIFIYPGEEIGVALTKQDEALGQPALATVTDPNGPVALEFPHPDAANLTFKFHEMDGKPDMLLTVDNRIDAVVKYDLVMYVAARDGYRGVRTSACGLMPPQGGQKSFMGFEHWPNPILMLAITNIRALPKGSAISCQ